MPAKQGSTHLNEARLTGTNSYHQGLLLFSPQLLSARSDAWPHDSVSRPLAALHYGPVRVYNVAVPFLYYSWFSFVFLTCVSFFLFLAVGLLLMFIFMNVCAFTVQLASCYV